MTYDATALCEGFRKGLVERRDFLKQLAVVTGSVVAASHVLSSMGFDGGLIQEAGAQEFPIEESSSQFAMSDRMVDYFLARPIVSGNSPGMVVIHENTGLSEFARNVARKLARRGAVALAPNVLPFATSFDGKYAPWMLETLRTGIAAVPEDEIDALNTGYDFLAAQPGVDTAHIGCVGFCWGGARSFTMATRNDRLWAAVVFYGSTPPFETLPSIKAPVLGLYGALDNNNATSITGRAAETAREMRRINKTFEWQVYNRAPHAFFRASDQTIATTPAATQAWDEMINFLARNWIRV
jgi:carboxymethylenebutenolidase